MKLVIVESPAKAKTIEKYLGKDYKVKASKGHVVDLPKSVMGVDFDNDYQPTYVVTKQAALTDIRKSLKLATELIIAADPDREGEAIGWHIARELGAVDAEGKPKGKYKGKVHRIVFTEITKEAIQNAVSNPRDINIDLVNAQEARRILDRIVGYKLSPLLWQKIRFGLSAGRVQSAALRIIVARELEREAFKSDEYWSLDVDTATKKPSKHPEIVFNLKESTEKEEEPHEQAKGTIRFSLDKVRSKSPQLGKQKNVEQVLEEIKNKNLAVTKIISKNAKRYPRAPFTTSTLQQSAANKFGFSAKRTMQIAQKLYEAGLITYMRTDSTNLSSQAIEQIRKYITKEYGPESLPAQPNLYTTKNKVAQEAHEAIRPTDITKSSKKLDLANEEERLYELIRGRAAGSQMVPAELEQSRVECELGEYLFVATGQRLISKGYLAAYHEKVNEQTLPSFKEGDTLFPVTYLADQHFTQPPARYTEASLIKKLESEGIGRPSTYAPTISTILARGYILKEGQALVPTDVGRVVDKLLLERFPDIVDLSFTSGMEGKLDDIANGELQWVKMIDDFYKPFIHNLEKQQGDLKRADYTVLAEAPKDTKCPECGSKMIVKLGRYGRFYSCSKFPDCKGMLSILPEGQTMDDLVKTFEPCPKTEDGREYLLKQGRFGSFWAHPDYPKVKDAKPVILKREFMIEKYGEIPQTDDGRDYLFRQGKFGPFWAHPDYPKVKDIKRIKKSK